MTTTPNPEMLAAAAGIAATFAGEFPGDDGSSADAVAWAVEAWASDGCPGATEADGEATEVFIPAFREALAMFPRRPDPAKVFHCECGEATGVRCEWTGPVSDLVLVEWMPEHLRASHEAAGNAGQYPHNGAVRLVAEEGCALDLVEADPEWTEILRPARADEAQGAEDEAQGAEDEDNTDDARPSNMHPALLADGWCVSDDEGGVWWPDDEAQAEIASASDPERAAVEMCQSSPMRGSWIA